MVLFCCTWFIWCYWFLLVLLVPAGATWGEQRSFPRLGHLVWLGWGKLFWPLGPVCLFWGHLLCLVLPGRILFLRWKRRASCLVESLLADNPWAPGTSWWRKGDSSSLGRLALSFITCCQWDTQFTWIAGEIWFNLKEEWAYLILRLPSVATCGLGNGGPKLPFCGLWYSET